MTYRDISKKLIGRNIKIRSKASGKIWIGKVKEIRESRNSVADMKVIIFDNGNECRTHENFSCNITYLD